jgi:hypothetical protein
VVLLLVRIGPSTSLAFRSSSPSSSSFDSSASTSSSSLPPVPQLQQEAADLAFTQWAKSNGIFSPSIACVTTPKSVGGRGLFATTPLEAGQVLGSIPHSLIFHSSDSEHWAADITQQVLKLLRKGQDENGKAEDDATIDDSRIEWVNSWNGGGCTSFQDALVFTSFSGGNGVSSKGTEQASSPSPLIDNPLLRDEVQQRLDRRIKTWKDGAATYGLDEADDFALYSLVYSRACFLGPSWAQKNTRKQDDGQTSTSSSQSNSSSAVIGVVPLFDMLNHYYPHGKQPNVELLSMGTALARMTNGPTKSSPADLNDKDMLLIATQAIEAGDELLTEYVDEVNDEYQDEDGHESSSLSSSESYTLKKVQTQARKLVQWGFL